MMNFFKLFLAGLFFSQCMSSQEKKAFTTEALKEQFLNQDKNTINLEEILNKHKGKILLIDIWASWCPDCINGLPKLKKLQADFPALQMVTLSYDKTFEAWQNGIQKHELIGDHYLIQSAWKGGDFRKQIDLDWIPRYILIDKSGQIVKYRSIEADDSDLINLLKTL
jgi:thiol-disulfide isomerase/thioredoxin